MKKSIYFALAVASLALFACNSKPANSEEQEEEQVETTLEQAEEFVDILKKNTSLYYNIDGKKATLHTIMSLYDKSSPSNVQRYKGLGEMDASELAESTLLVYCIEYVFLVPPSGQPVKI